MRGELDWIVMKALEKDRNRRYGTANGLAADLRRYLDDEPVQACPPSARYRFGKFARRNKQALLTASIVALALLAGTVVSTWQAIRASLLFAVNRLPDAERHLAAVLDMAGRPTEMKNRPDMIDRSRSVLPLVLARQGKWAEAAAAFRRAVDHFAERVKQSGGPHDRKNLATAENDFAWLLATCPDAKRRDPDRAVELARKAVELAPKE